MLVANGVALYSFNSAPTWLMSVTAFTIVLMDVPLVILMLKLFSVGDRYRSLSIGHAIGTTIFSSVTPAIATWFWQKFQHPIAPLVYGIFLILIGAFAASLAKIKDEPTIMPNLRKKIISFNQFSVRLL